MSRGAHTRGPWIGLPEEPGVPYIRIRGTVLGGRYKIANVLRPDYDGADALEGAETRANARLIVLAPLLLELAREMASCCSGELWMSDDELRALRDDVTEQPEARHLAAAFLQARDLVAQAECPL